MNPSTNTEALGQLTLAYSPILDQTQAVVATRLMVRPRNPRAVPNPDGLLELISEIWSTPEAQVSLQLGSRSMLRHVLNLRPPVNVWIEVPASAIAEPACADGLRTLYGNGNTLLLRVEEQMKVPDSFLPCYRYAIGNASDCAGGRLAAAYPGIAWMQTSVTSAAEMRESLALGAAGVMGWPFPDAALPAARNPDTRNDVLVVIELLRGIHAEAPVEELEAILSRDPALAYKLMRYINSAAFGFTTKIESFTHAIMMLGYQNLQRWLALLLATADEDPEQQVVNFAAVRRALLMEALGKRVGNTEQTCNELFICGVFSLLDRIFRQPMQELLTRVFVSQDVVDALIKGMGPLVSYLRLAKAMERGAWAEAEKMGNTLLLSPLDINSALVDALETAERLR